jgi:hypothetical protein
MSSPEEGGNWEYLYTNFQPASVEVLRVTAESISGGFAAGVMCFFRNLLAVTSW